MMDMSSVIIPRSDQLNADSLIAGPLTVTIENVKIEGGTEQPVTIMLKNNPLVYRPCKSMSRVLVSAWGPDARAYIGRGLTLYRDPKVKWGGMEVGGIRISHMTDIDKELTLMLTMTKQNRAPHRVKPLATANDAPPVEILQSDIDAACAIARQGSDAFRAWFKANPDKRPAANSVMDQIKAIAAVADAAQPTDADDKPPL